jgi:hypothetical protein
MGRPSPLAFLLYSALVVKQVSPRQFAKKMPMGVIRCLSILPMLSLVFLPLLALWMRLRIRVFEECRDKPFSWSEGRAKQVAIDIGPTVYPYEVLPYRNEQTV